MSYYLHPNSAILFGTAGIMKEGYDRTMCLSVVTPNRHGEQFCDVHMSREQMEQMRDRLNEELEWMKKYDSKVEDENFLQ